MEITRRNVFWGNFLEVCCRTAGTSQKLLQKSALRCIRLLFVLLLFESKLLPAVLLLQRIYFPKIIVTVTVLKFG